MVGRTLHSSGLVPTSLSAQVLDFIVQGRLGLLGLAAAAEVVSAECRFNYWVATYLKKAGLSEEQWMRLLDDGERNEDRCRAAMAALSQSIGYALRSTLGLPLAPTTPKGYRPQVRAIRYI